MRLAGEDACHGTRGYDACTGLRPCQPKISYNITAEMAHQGSSPKHGTPSPDYFLRFPPDDEPSRCSEWGRDKGHVAYCHVTTYPWLRAVACQLSRQHQQRYRDAQGHEAARVVFTQCNEQLLYSCSTFYLSEKQGSVDSNG
jgi:hypothetical protein